jgi:hypothetical protein
MPLEKEIRPVLPGQEQSFANLRRLQAFARSQREGPEPNLEFTPALLDVDMRRLIPFPGMEVEAVTVESQNGGHRMAFIGKNVKSGPNLSPNRSSDAFFWAILTETPDCGGAF